MSNYYIFKNYNFNVNEHPFQCDDTLQSKCIKGIDKDKCLEICSKDKYCSIAYYSNKDKLCYPYYTEKYSEINPYNFMLKTKKDDIVFVDKNKHPYPSDNSFIIHFSDTVTLYNPKNNTGLITTDSNSDNIKFLKDAEIKLKIIKKYYFDIEYIVNYGDQIAFNLNGTNLLLTNEILENKKEYNIGIKDSARRSLDIFWKNQYSDIIPESSLFRILPIKKDKHKTPIIFNTEFYIKDVTKNLFLYLNNKNELKMGIHKMKFILKPNGINGYYCDENVCKSILLDDCEQLNEKARYNNKIVVRNKNCQCDVIDEEITLGKVYNSIESKKNNYYFFIIFIIIIFLLFLIYIII